MNNLLDLNEIYKYTKMQQIPLTNQRAFVALKLDVNAIDLIQNNGIIENIAELSAFLTITKNAEYLHITLKKPVELMRIQHHGSIKIIFEAKYNCEIIEEIYTNANIEINYIVQENVILKHNILHINLAHNRYLLDVQVDKNANYISKFINIYCQQLQVIANIALNGSEAKSINHILNYADEHDNLDILLLIAHHSSYTTSQTNAQAIAQNNAISSILGKIYVGYDIEQINADLQIKNLLDSKNATCNARPQLEIYSNDVKCSHGSTTGSLNAEAIYYMQARGIDLEIAKKLLRAAFIIGIMQHIQMPALKSHIYNILNLTTD